MAEGLSCPHCAIPLQPRRFGEKIAWTCATCSGVAFNLAVLRAEVDSATVAQFWSAARKAPMGSARCPSCRKGLRLVTHRTVRASLDVDLCVPCQLVWLDGGELEVINQGAPRRSVPRRPSRPSATRMDLSYSAPPQSSVGDVLDLVINIVFTSVV